MNAEVVLAVMVTKRDSFVEVLKAMCFLAVQYMFMSVVVCLEVLHHTVSSPGHEYGWSPSRTCWNRKD